MKSVSFVLPCFNEEENIEYTLTELQNILSEIKCDYEVIVVDNNSTDNSIEIAKKFNFVKIVYEPLKGYGAAIRKGIKSAKNDFICTFDLDSTYTLSSIPEMIKLIDNYNLIVGNRYYKENNNFPLINKIGASILSSIGRFFSKVNISDWHCGLRIFRRDIGLLCSSTGMEFASEIIIYHSEQKAINVPVLMRDSINKRTVKLRRIRDGIRHLNLIIKERK